MMRSVAMKRALVAVPLGLAAALLFVGTGRNRGVARAADPDVCAKLPPADRDKIDAWTDAECYKKPALGFVRDKEEKRKTGPTRPTAPHGRVTVYYAPQIVAWLRNNRRGQIPDGALIIKEMYDWDSGEFNGRATMMKHKASNYAGWYFSPGDVLAGGCVGCHASALSELTFSDLEHIDGKPHVSMGRGAAQSSSLVLASHPADKKQRADRPQVLSLDDEAMAVPPPSRLGLNLRDNPEFARFYPRPPELSRQSVFPFPAWDTARPFVAKRPGPAMFLPATNCFGCHDAQVADKESPMVLPAPRSHQFLNLSPYAEWSASLMGLSGRDPVFHAQLESEKALRPDQSAAIDDACYRCHGAAGQRQIHLDLNRPFAHDMVYAQGDHALARYGALARDGVTCTVCHHMAKSGLGEERTFTGQFELSKPDEMFGPYSDNVRAEPMKQLLGVTVRGGDHIRSSAMCGSCHTVILPRVPSGYRGDPFSDRSLGREHEQTTYLEWRNSAYQNESSPGPDARTCQSCHMPVQFESLQGGAPLVLSSKIANIEEFMPHVPGSLPEAEITLSVRKPYARHSLVGINLFVMQMFSQFAGVLGIARRDPRADGPEFLSSLNLSQREALNMAQRQTARVDLVEPARVVKEGGGTLLTTVRVTNLAGHKFPSGVGFRRAFLEFVVRDSDDKVVWASGQTDSLGVILGENGQPLPSEFTQDPAALQPHHNRITRPDQVQIFEERTTDQSNRLTTSFLGLFHHAKDTRLLPKGWSPSARNTEFMQPVDVGGKKIYQEGRNYHDVTYAVALSPAAQKKSLTVQASLYYQSIPPYYLKERFATAKGPETQRLYLLTSGLDTSGTLRDWKLLVASSGKLAVKTP